MKDEVMKLKNRLRDAIVILHNRKGHIEISTTYTNANNIIMKCLMDGIEPTNEDLDFVKLIVECYEEQAAGMG